jgi:branched-chain amino acid transport system ATP-binding protein
VSDDATDDVVGGKVVAGESTVSADDLIIKAEHLTLRFGGVISLRDVSFEMRRGEILAVIGPNGAGKTSLFNSLTGVYQPQEGTITFSPLDRAPLNVIGKKAYRLSQAGVSRTFQASRLFTALSVFENIKIGAEDHHGIGLVGALVKGPRTRRGEHRSDDVVIDLLDFVGLSAEANLIASQLSYGARRRLEIGRALATHPQVILLDEPAAGTNPSEKLELANLIRRVRDERGVSVLLIEHDMKLIMSLAERLYVLNFGSVIAEGSPDEIRANQAVIDAYLGTAHEETSA